MGFVKVIYHPKKWIAFLLLFKYLEKAEKLDVIDGWDANDVTQLIDIIRGIYRLQKVDEHETVDEPGTQNSSNSRVIILKLK